LFRAAACVCFRRTQSKEPPIAIAETTKPIISNAAWLSRCNAAVVRGIGHTTGIFTAHARNAEIWDVEGKRYVERVASRC